MLSGGYPVFFGLRFFSVVFLFDDCVCRALFIFCGRLAAAVFVTSLLLPLNVPALASFLILSCTVSEI